MSGFRQTKCKVLMNKEATKIVNFTFPVAGILVLGHGHISHILKMRKS